MILPSEKKCDCQRKAGSPDRNRFNVACMLAAYQKVTLHSSHIPSNFLCLMTLYDGFLQMLELIDVNDVPIMSTEFFQLVPIK